MEYLCMNTYLWNTDEYLFLRMHMKCLRNTYGIPTNAYGTPMYLRVPTNAYGTPMYLRVRTNPYGIPTNDWNSCETPMYLRVPTEPL